MKSTTIYVPVTTAQAEWSFLNRSEAFKRGFNCGPNGQLLAYQNREDAIAAESGKHIRSFAVLRITFDAVRHESLAYFGKLRAFDNRWLVTGEGLAELSADADLSMEILPGNYQLSEQQKIDVFSLPDGGPTGFGGC